jgi:hypothetical protein
MTKREKQLSQWRDHNKWLKSRHLPKQSFDEYLQYITGKLKVIPRLNNRPQSNVYRRETKSYASADMAKSNYIPPKIEPKTYNGERILLGIATMHKSNMVPVFDAEHAIDLARMRR